MGEVGGREEKGRAFLSVSSLPFSLPSFPFSPETPDTQASFYRSLTCRAALHAPLGWVCAARDSKLAPRSKKNSPKIDTPF